MSSDKPVFSDSDLPPLIQHLPKKSGSIASSEIEDASESHHKTGFDLREDRDVDLASEASFHSAVETYSSFGADKDFNSGESHLPHKHHKHPLECSTKERVRGVSWGAMELHDATTNSSSISVPFEISGASSQQHVVHHENRLSSNHNNYNKSQRVRHKSNVQFDDVLLQDDSARLIYINDPKRTDDKCELPGNEIRTSKYTIVTFLPKNLFIQFHRVAYLYFLAIAALNQLPPLAVFGRTVSLFPLLFVLCVTAIKDGYEDWRRHRSDRNENNRESLVLQHDDFRPKKWKNIQAGEVVKIFADETIPADMVLLGTSDQSGLAYIQTMNLDGESNLKTRYAKQETTNAVSSEGCHVSGVIRCEQPNRNIYEFTANMEFNGLKFSLSQSNIVLRGCQLKNTDWIIGVVVYAGQDTKAMMNSTPSPSKRSKLENKTGTLTENKMEFRRASVNGKNYGNSLVMADDTAAAAVIPRRRWKLQSEIPVDPELLTVLQRESHGDDRIAAHEFFLTLAACNTVIPIPTGDTFSRTSDTNEDMEGIEYQGESPDEQALVSAASAYGYTLFERTSGHIVIDVNGEKLRLDVLGLHEFDSVRKRMSVVIRFPNNIVKVLVKGADTTMFSILANDSESHNTIRDVTQSHLNEYSSIGLRTLVVASRDLSNAELEEWQSMYEEASTSLHERAAKLRQTAAFIECNLKLLGATGIEDKLQEGVPEAIESLRQAGIKVWVLTGDKQETAISIGLSCKLLTADMQQIIINGTSEVDCRNLLGDAKAKYGVKSSTNQNRKQKSNSGLGDLDIPNGSKSLSLPKWNPGQEEGTTAPLALIIDGNSLVYILEKELESELFDLATSWANDVSMIQMADVGVGICGQEGRQAVMASDFAMGQFQFLKKLLLVHGHWNYQRVAYLILYNFYRNAVFVLMLFWYILCTAFSTTSALTDWSSVFYSVIYTSVPTIFVGILDKDLSHRTLLKYPKLYAAGHRQEAYNLQLFWITMIDTVWQSLVLFYTPLFTYKDSTIDIWSMGSLWTIAVVILVNVHLAMDINRWVLITHAAVWGSIIITYGCMVVLDSIPVFPNYWTIYHLAVSPTYWITIVLIIIVALLPRFTCKVVCQIFWPSDIQIAREAELLRKRHNHLQSRQQVSS
ncbi:hypothetical protein PIB30_067061 [Stylosanthes scabra]|uniref:Phospholipid-transporting ATPase n=1 Tax=Stylosanthes scabra TaxID=79078 RepID=A0ABU6WKW0_9FABA|nr:hypothetical protein [Stylosanthes scabra]